LVLGHCLVAKLLSLVLLKLLPIQKWFFVDYIHKLKCCLDVW
jgi:hypothetical protein